MPKNDSKLERDFEFSLRLILNWKIKFVPYCF